MPQARSRTTGRAQQQPKQENPRVTTPPSDHANLAWKIEMKLPAVGTISVNASNNIDLLSAYNGLMAVQDALQCGKCQGTNVRLTHKTMTGQNGEYDQFVMCCQNPDCRAMYSFSVMRDAPDMLVESFKDEFKGWFLPTNGNGNGGSKEAPSRGSRTETKPSARTSQSRTSRTTRQEEPDDEYDEDSGDDGTVPF